MRWHSASYLRRPFAELLAWTSNFCCCCCSSAVHSEEYAPRRSQQTGKNNYIVPRLFARFWNESCGRVPHSVCQSRLWQHVDPVGHDQNRRGVRSVWNWWSFSREKLHMKGLLLPVQHLCWWFLCHRDMDSGWDAGVLFGGNIWHAAEYQELWRTTEWLSCMIDAFDRKYLYSIKVY